MSGVLPRSYDRRQGTPGGSSGSSAAAQPVSFGVASPAAYSGSATGYWHPEERKAGTSFTLGSKSLFYFLVVASILLFIVCVVLLVLFIINLTATAAVNPACTTSSTSTTFGPTASPGQCNEIDLMLLIDNSQFLSASDFTTIRTFLSNKFVTEYVISLSKVRLSCVAYAKFPVPIFNLDNVNSVNEAQQLINSVLQSTDTDAQLNMNDALLLEQTPIGNRPNARNVIVLFASNVPNNFTQTKQVAGTLRSQGTTIYTISVGINGPDLHEISDGQFVVRHIEQLDEVADKLHATMCTQ